MCRIPPHCYGTLYGSVAPNRKFRPLATRPGAAVASRRGYLELHHVLIRVGVTRCRALRLSERRAKPFALTVAETATMPIPGGVEALAIPFLIGYICLVTILCHYWFPFNGRSRRWTGRATRPAPGQRG